MSKYAPRQWAPDEKPMLPGPPSTPAHPTPLRFAYLFVGILVTITGGLGNALVVVNLAKLQGVLGANSTETNWLLLKLPPGDRFKAFRPMDFVTFALFAPGVALLCVVLGACWGGSSSPGAAWRWRSRWCCWPPPSASSTTAPIRWRPTSICTGRWEAAGRRRPEHVSALQSRPSRIAAP